MVELHLRSYQERKCESLQSNFKLNSLSNFKSFRLRTTAVRGLQSKCKETVTNHGRRLAMLLQKMGNVELSLRTGQSRAKSKINRLLQALQHWLLPPPTQHYCNTNYFRPIHYFPTTAIIVCSIIVSSLRTFARNFLRKFWF